MENLEKNNLKNRQPEEMNNGSPQKKNNMIRIRKKPKTKNKLSTHL